MNKFIWFIRRILALVLGLFGVGYGLHCYMVQHDAGGALAIMAGCGLAASMLINE